MSPFDEYSRRLSARQAERDRWQREFIRIGNARLVVGLLTAGLAWAVFGPHLVPLWGLTLPVALFAALVVRLQRAVRERTLCDRAVRFYQDGLQRMQDQWSGQGETGERFRVKDHVYADDLDLFGQGSLFQLVSRARTSMGEACLADWLLSPADLGEARARQEAMLELRARLDLREDLALLGDDVGAGLEAERLRTWASSPSVGFSPAWKAIAAVLAVLGVAFLIVFLLGRLPLFPLAAVLGCDFAIIYGLRQRVARTLDGIDAPARDLKLLSLLLARLEKETFECAKLRAITSVLPASNAIARLGRWMDWIDSLDHALVRALRPLLLWREQCAFAMDRWRSEYGAKAGDWLRITGEFEALASLASLSYERPEWCFPELAEDAGTGFHAKGLQHPLLASSRCVPNDVDIGPLPKLIIVSGSNMSGKSTLLRSIGLGTVLAWAGAPAPARALTLSRLFTGASIRVTDSLQDNRSRFLAEIARLRQIMDAARAGHPVLFLLDELLSGTNSHDRRIGAAAIVTGLLEAGATGFITTHDLALAEMEEDLGGAMVSNAHFEDELRDGEMVFDYRLRPGVVTHSNALALMKAIGLTV